MRRWGWLGLCLLLLPMQGEAGVPRNVPPIDDTLLRNFLKSLSDHLNTLECLTQNPDGTVLGTHGELKCAVYMDTGASVSTHHICLNSCTRPSKTTDWICVNIENLVSPTTGIFCGGTLSTSMNCENFRGRIPVACTLSRVDLTVSAAPTGAAFLVDVNECSAPGTWTTVFTTQANRPTIAVSTLSGNSTTFNDTSIALGNYIGFDLDQVGSSVTGSNLTVTVVCQ